VKKPQNLKILVFSLNNNQNSNPITSLSYTGFVLYSDMPITPNESVVVEIVFLGRFCELENDPLWDSQIDAHKNLSRKSLAHEKKAHIKCVNVQVVSWPQLSA